MFATGGQITVPSARLKSFLDIPTTNMSTIPDPSATSSKPKTSRFFPVVPPPTEHTKGKMMAATAYDLIEETNTQKGDLLNDNKHMSRLTRPSSSEEDTYHAQNSQPNIDRLFHDGPRTSFQTTLSTLDPAAPEFMFNVDKNALAIKVALAFESEIYHAQSVPARLNQFINYDPTALTETPFSASDPRAPGYIMFETERARLQISFARLEQQWHTQTRLLKKRIKNWDYHTHYNVNVQTALETVAAVSRSITFVADSRKEHFLGRIQGNRKKIRRDACNGSLS